MQPRSLLHGARCNQMPSAIELVTSGRRANSQHVGVLQPVGLPHLSTPSQEPCTGDGRARHQEETTALDK